MKNAIPWEWSNDYHVTSLGQRKHLSPRQELNLWLSTHGLDALTNELRETRDEQHMCRLNISFLYDMRPVYC